MKRLMRLRATQHLRDLCAETDFNRAQLIQPFFVVEGLKAGADRFCDDVGASSCEGFTPQAVPDVPRRRRPW